MFGGYAKGMAYASNFEAELETSPPFCNDEETADIMCVETAPTTTLFGGFELWPKENADFILVAECSEICGPNPICTIPNIINPDINLTSLAVSILSSDYQEFSSSNSLPTKDIQVLIPDVMVGIHAAVNHFVLYDAEARGFVRSFCIAYVTPDKHKLTELDQDIFKNLKHASLFIQHSNKNFSKKGLELLVQDLQLTKSQLKSYCGSHQSDIEAYQTSQLYDQLIQSSLQDIHNILSSMKSVSMFAVEEIIDQLIDELKKKFKLKYDLSSLCNSDCETSDYEPKVLTLPLQQNFDQPLRNLFILSPGGALMAFYHLHITHKYFKRSYEDIFLQMCEPEWDDHSSVRNLYVGACLKLNSWIKGRITDQCDVNYGKCQTTLSFYNSHYISHLDVEIGSRVLKFLESTFPDRNLTNLITDIDDLNLTESDGAETKNSVEEVKNPNCCKCNRHVLNFNEMFSLVEHLSAKIPGIEKSALKVLQGSCCTEDILFSILTRVPIIIFYSVEEEFVVSNFVRVIAAFMPRKPSEPLLAEHNRKTALRKEDLADMAIVTFCIQHTNFSSVPSELLPYVSVLHLKDVSFHGPKYTGKVLNGLNETVRTMSYEEPVFMFLISIFSEIEVRAKIWGTMRVSSVKSTTFFPYFTEPDFTECDTRILQAVSKLIYDPK